MDFQEMEIRKSYISYGDETIAKALVGPAMERAVLYQRSVGFFSASVLQTIMGSIPRFVKNGGRIQLVSSPRLRQEDHDAISLGYEMRKSIINQRFSEDFSEQIEMLSTPDLQILAEMIGHGILDIKIAITRQAGIYHDKLGILHDKKGNIIVFYGSANSTVSGYEINYEKVRVVCSWKPGEMESVQDEVAEFEALWGNQNPYMEVTDYSESARKHILQTIEQRERNDKNQEPIKLRDYQKDAINAWVENGYKGFNIMATGTGKTWTAIYSAKELLKKEHALIVICAPYKHLVRQWAEDVRAAFPKARIVLVSSENPKWSGQIREEIIRGRYDFHSQLIIISTIVSFQLERFTQAVDLYKGKRLLIVDEAHRFKIRTEDLWKAYPYRLGLSATPFSGHSAKSGQELIQYFGGLVYELPIETALEKGFLVPYRYIPIFVSAAEEEEQRFQIQTNIIRACFKNEVCIDPDTLVKAIRNRLRIISMAQEKLDKIDWILDQIQEKDHVVAYCGDGKLFDDSGQEIRHIQFVKAALARHGYRPSQFTAKENMDQRMNLVNTFNRGEVTALAAIRCLDEGINIPSIKGALILSSNDDYREFVQRRGRILRTYSDNGKVKKGALIYDVVVLPTLACSGWAAIELRRFYEYARLASNQSELELQFDSLMQKYGFLLEDIRTFDFDDIEEAMDE